ncbi:MAG: hypothetical protein IIA87_00580 [Nanoarchaeota archaeon]|nr:hypothetical protein [Nanoarchaeota archaeon]
MKFDPVLEAERVKRLNDLVGGVENYDIFVSTDVDSYSEVRAKSGLFDALENLCEELGHKPFMPHHFAFDDNGRETLEARDLYVLVNELMVPKCDLFLGYLGIMSTGVGMMVGKAMLERKDIIFFHEKGNKLETVSDVRKLVRGTSMDSLTDPEILNSPRIFYHHDHPHGPLIPYPHLRGVVRFDGVSECVDKLRVEIKRYAEG